MNCRSRQPAGAAVVVLSKNFLPHEIIEPFTAIVGATVKRRK